MAQNKLVGSLPGDWLDPMVSYMQLQYINLAENMLGGSIPAGTVRTTALCNPNFAGYHRCCNARVGFVASQSAGMAVRNSLMPIVCQCHSPICLLICWLSPFCSLVQRHCQPTVTDPKRQPWLNRQRQRHQASRQLADSAHSQHQHLRQF
jgi:hypothetical protein